MGLWHMRGTQLLLAGKETKGGWWCPIDQICAPRKKAGKVGLVEAQGIIAGAKSVCRGSIFMP